MDLRKLKTLIDLVQDSGIAELEIKEGEETVRIIRVQQGAASAVPVMAALPDLTMEPMAFSTILDRPPFLLPGVVLALRSALPRCK